ncbi:hypothetical protein CVT26_000282, partial [Gymnopilus dilepis]
DTQLYVFDPLAIKQVINNVDTYPPTDLFLQANRMMLGTGLLSCVDITPGAAHRRQRRLLSHAFSPENLRLMSPIFFDVADTIKTVIRTELENSPIDSTTIDLLALASKGALEIVGKAGLGYSFQPFSDYKHPYIQAFQTLIPIVFGMFTARKTIESFVDYIPPSFGRFVVEWTPWGKLQRIVKMVDILDKMSEEVYSERLSDLVSDKYQSSSLEAKGNDVISTIIKQNAKIPLEERLSEADIRGQVATLILTATDTTAGAISRILHVLAEHPIAQEKLRQEVRQTQLSFDTVQSLPFLDAVCKETLRLHPPVPFTTRTTKQSSVLTVSKPIRTEDGNTISDMFIPKNTKIVVGILAYNRNREIWGPDADVWNPERWFDLPEAVKSNNHAGVYSNTMTFYGGGKGCIGYKFSELEIKIVVSTLIQAYSFTLGDEKIKWCYPGMAKPMVDGNASPQMPLRVTASPDS